LVDRLRRLHPKDVLACDEEIRQRAGDDEPVRVLGEAAVAHLGEAENPFDHADGMLDLGADPRLPTIRRALRAAQRSITPGFAMGKVARVRSAGVQHGALSRVGRVAPHAPLTTVQQLGQCLAVVDIRRRGRHGVNELALAIDPEMGLHPEIPLLAFSWSDASRDPACRSRSSSTTARQ